MVVVTGATGHLGGVLVRELLKSGEQVRIITRAQSDLAGMTGLPVEVYACGLTDGPQLRQAFAGASVVYHAAARISLGANDEEALDLVNVQGTQAVIDAARATGVGRLVHVGSIEAFPLTERRFPVTESQGVDPEHTVMEYGRSKARSTQIVLEAVQNGLDAVVACPTSFIGPPDFRLSPMGRMIYDFARRRLPAYVSGGFDFADVRDIAHGVVLAGQKGRRGECYLLSGDYLSIPELMDLLEQLSGVRKPLLCFPTALLMPLMPLVELYYRVAGKPPRFTRNSLHILSLEATVDSSKAQRELGYSARPLACTVRDLLRWYYDTGILKAPDLPTDATEPGVCPEESEAQATTQTE